MNQIIQDGNGMKDITWVFFDFDGTLRHNEPNGLNTFHQFVEDRGFNLAESVRRQAHRWNHRYWARSEMLKQDSEEAGDEVEGLYRRYTRRYLEQLGIHSQELDHLSVELHQQMAEEYSPIDFVPVEVHPTLKDLSRLGFSLALISNRQHPLDKKVDELDLSGYFEFTLAAGEVGRWKPDPAILQFAIEMAAIEPSQAVYIGDNPYADVAGAQAAEIQPILLDPEGLFPEVDCPVIVTLDQIVSLLTQTRIR